MPNEIIQRTCFAITSKPRVLDVALDDAAMLQQATDAPGDLLDQTLQLGSGRLGHMAEHGRGAVDWQVHAIGQDQRWMQTKGLSERRCLGVAGMSASVLRYQPRPDLNVHLRQRIVGLAQRHRRYGQGMIYQKLRQAGLAVHHKRVERLYGLEQLQIKRRKRKKIPASERQPLIRPGGPNEVWSMDFVFDRVAGGGVIKCLTVVDDATNESVVIEAEHAISGQYLTRVLDRVCSERGAPKVIRTDNGPEFTGAAMLSWAYRRGIELKLIEPGKPNQNAYIESFNGRFRDECLNEHWFTSLAHAKAEIEAWRREYNEQRPKRNLGGLTPAQYAKKLTQRVVTMPDGL